MRWSSGLQVLLVLLSGTALALAIWWIAHELVVSRAVSESQTVADMAENIGRWASQYGGLHARTEGATSAIPGTFLTRSVYADSEGDVTLLKGAKMDDPYSARLAMSRVEAYHWKNPALIQREVSDVMLASGSRALYRLTARTVLNRNNAPNAFEIEAMDKLQSTYKEQAEPVGNPAVASAANNPINKANANLEYWKVQANQLLYARAVIAQSSCLRCHDTPDKAPEFLRTNKQFNGGGGFGYVVGKPIGIISVSIPIPSTTSVLKEGLSLQVWVAIGASIVAMLGVLMLAMRNYFGTQMPRVSTRKVT